MITLPTHARPRVYDSVYTSAPAHQTFGDTTCSVCGYPLHVDDPDPQPVVLVLLGAAMVHPGRGIGTAAIPIHLSCSGWTRQQVESGEALQ